MYMPENCNLEDVAHIKKFVDIPVVCAGRMDPAVGAAAIAEGRIDGVGIARQFLVPGGMVDGHEVKMVVKVGDKVVVAKYAGTEVKLDDKEYSIVRQSDILAIVE